MVIVFEIPTDQEGYKEELCSAFGVCADGGSPGFDSDTIYSVVIPLFCVALDPIANDIYNSLVKPKLHELWPYIKEGIRRHVRIKVGRDEHDTKTIASDATEDELEELAADLLDDSGEPDVS